MKTPFVTKAQLDAITALQFDRLNEMLVVKGLNDPAHCYLE